MNGVPFLYNVQWKIEKMTTGQRNSPKFKQFLSNSSAN